MDKEKYYEMYKSHPLYGRRILHVLSPVRWKGSKFLHHLDANYKVMNKTVEWLPMCHHYILVPPNNTILNDRDNVTLIKFSYAGSVLFNRGFFNSREFLNSFDFTSMDVDFIFNHQPELTYNILNTTQTARYGCSIDSFLFFHWVDCSKSRSFNFPLGFMRQLEAMTLSSKTYFHCDVSLEYLKSNFNDNEFAFKGINEQYLKNKISYMPLSPDKFSESVSFKLPNKKILVFNHRWNKSTGINKLASYTKELSDEYLIWFTDRNATNPAAGKSALEVFKNHKCSIKVKGLPSGEYKYLLENCYATLCFVDNYMTWNLAVQDGICLGTPTLIYDHEIQKYIIGDKYPLIFKNKEKFIELLNRLETVAGRFHWELPSHDMEFKNNLHNDLIKCVNDKKIRNSKYNLIWLWHILKGNNYKKNILLNTHPNLYSSNVWEWLRVWCMKQGVKDDPLSKYTKLFVLEKDVERLKQLVHGVDLTTLSSYFSYDENKKDPSFMPDENLFW